MTRSNISKFENTYIYYIPYSIRHFVTNQELCHEQRTKKNIVVYDYNDLEGIPRQNTKKYKK